MFGGNAEGLQTPGRSVIKLLSLEILRSNLYWHRAERRRRSALLLRRSPQKAAWTPQIQTEKQQKTAGGGGSGLVSAHPDPGESRSSGSGGEGPSGWSSDRVWENRRLRRSHHPAHPDLQTERPGAGGQGAGPGSDQRAGPAGPDRDEAADVRVADISSKADVSSQRPILMEKPDVVVGTPSRVLAHINAHNLDLQASLEVLVVDEADLIFWFGFEADLKSLLCHLPKI
ncbi:hypothetical protein OJAV_G00177660 [Oryzias javanicus]|uniref:RNA helicase n=1 Tax=Oryzias javanicus TaxID=123683 RepID=A0A3S2LVJ9_ORYJA|nr:hypothetical protein OJAV_G00177660 [Oryzias javanicus]